MSDSGVLEMRGVDAGYTESPVLHRADLVIREGEIVAVVGANGAGKSTAVRCLMGLIPLRRGAIFLDGVDISRVPAWKRARMGIGCVPERRQIFGELTVRENLVVGILAASSRASRHDVSDRIDEVVGIFPLLGTMLGKTASLLSGGQQQMLAIGRSLMSRPRFLVLDEPSLGLAPSLVTEIFGMIQQTATTAGVLVLEQNARAALSIADRAVMFSDGHVVMSGTGQELLHSEQLSTLYLGRSDPGVQHPETSVADRLRAIIGSGR